MTDIDESQGAQLLFNPFEPGFAENPYPAYARLRDADPVHESPLGAWLLSRYEDVSALLRSPLSVDPRNLAPGTFAGQHTRFERPIRGVSVLDLDPPDHTRLRSLVTKVFTPRSIAGLEPMIIDLVDRALDTIAADGQADLVETLAFPMPFEVISRMLGMSVSDTIHVRELSGTIGRSLDIVADEAVALAIERASDELDMITAEVIATKRSNPGDDLLTALIAAEEQGDKLTETELIAQVEFLYMAGHETTTSLIAGGALALLEYPDQLALVRSDPEKLSANAVEELLRYVSPVQQSRRITTGPYSVRGREIPPGSFVVAVLAAANRDEQFWGPDAARLDIRREKARQHVSFGAGLHHCLGAALARLQTRIAIERLVRRFPGLALDPDGTVEWNGRMILRGPSRLPITV